MTGAPGCRRNVDEGSRWSRCSGRKGGGPLRRSKGKFGGVQIAVATSAGRRGARHGPVASADLLGSSAPDILQQEREHPFQAGPFAIVKLPATAAKRTPVKMATVTMKTFFSTVPRRRHDRLLFRFGAGPDSRVHT
ncbi:unnamed protein product [Urochloa humidicola]